jgi:hypothetical protein
VIADGGLTIAKTSGLQLALDSKSSKLTDLAGNGTSIIQDASQAILRKINGHDGIDVLQFVDLADATNPDNEQLRISGTSLLTAINLKQPALTSASVVSIDSLTATNGITTSSVKALAGSSLSLSNNLGTGVTVASDGNIGVRTSAPQSALDVNGLVLCADLTASGQLVASEMTVVEGVAGANTAFTVENSSGTGTANHFMLAAGVQSQHFVGGAGEYVISTTTAHPIRFQADRLFAAVSALTIAANNQCSFGANVGILTAAPTTALDVNGGIACTQLAIQGADVATSLGTKQDALSTVAGQGVPVLSTPTELRRIFGEDGIT